MINVLSAMAEIMKKLNLTYDYLELKRTLSYPYIIGEYFENGYTYETNCSEGEFLLTIWDKNESSIPIIELNQKIKDNLKDLTINKDGNTIFFSYSNSLPEQQEADNLKKIEVRIEVKYFEKGE